MAHIDGTIGSDTLDGTNTADVISGADSGDTILGRDGNDVLYGFGVGDSGPNAGVIQVDRIVDGLGQALYGTSPPGDPDRLFVAVQDTGEIKIVDLAGNTVAGTPFLDIPNGEISHGGEQGLLGLAFDPNYATNGKFYIDITNEDGDTEIWQCKRSAGDPDTADPTSRKLIIRIDQPFDNHNGGWIAFGPDRYLYVAMGDGGSGGDPFGNAQNTGSLLGKMLRIDVHGDDFPGNRQKNYAIPSDNPFVGIAGADEVWAYGLRNPWRNSFDSATGDLYIGDVGQTEHEEIDYAAAGTPFGLNFGWNVREGNFAYNGADDPAFTDPIVDVAHHGPDLYSGNVIIGGYVYRGPGGGQGLYFFNDLGSNNFWTTRVVDGVATQYTNIGDYLRGDVGGFDSIASWAVDGMGRLYAVGLDGELFRITPSDAAGDAADEMRGGDGDDSIFGGGGDDFLKGGEGDDALDGGRGGDTANYAAAAVAVTVNLNVGGAQNTGAGHDTLSSIENVSGSAHDDRLTGDDGANTLTGKRGDDTLIGRSGADTFIGGRGADSLRGGEGSDTFVYEDVLESRSSASDVVDDLNNNDTIDLSAIDADTTAGGNQRFHLASDFSGETRELILVLRGGDTLLKGDVDGDGKADIVVTLTGNHTDFVNFVF